MTDVPTASVSSEPLDFADLFAAEENHFWFRSRVRVISTLVRQLVADLSPGYQVLEVGCGTGFVLRELERVCSHGEVTGLDLFDEGLRFARARTQCRLVKADIHQMPFTSPFDVIGMFDVLEHLEDDCRILRSLHGRLTGNGRLILTVPAHMWLWSYADEYAQHYRRYSLASLEQVLRTAGFRVEYSTEFMVPMVPLMWLARRWAALWQRARGTDAEQNRRLFRNDLRIVPGLNGLMNRVFACEVPLLARRFRLPLGTSLLAIAAPVQPSDARARQHVA